uniref:Uncharacterized protein n=1 Tax=Pararge aegeria TaxID=116150 RepID=S4P130_9NEOP
MQSHLVVKDVAVYGNVLTCSSFPGPFPYLTGLEPSVVRMASANLLPIPLIGCTRHRTGTLNHLAARPSR